LEFTLLFAAATALAAVWIANRLTKPEVDKPTDLLIGAAAVGLFIGRIAAMLLAGVNPITNPADILIVRAGVDTGFATIGALVALTWATRADLPRVSDLLAPAALAGLAGWHAGCVWRGACLGTVSDLPWAIAQSGSTVTRHPVEIYAAVGMLLTAYLVARLARTPWLRTGAALGLAAVVRIATQPVRPSLTGGPMWWYYAGATVGLVTVMWAIAGRRMKPSLSGPATGRERPPPG